MTPYYDDGSCVIYHGDALDLIPTLSADVLVTDPPYGLQELAGSYGRHGAQIANDIDTVARDAALALWGDKPAMVFCSPRLPEPPGGWEHRLVWDKKEPGMNGGPWRYNHESIMVRGLGWTRADASSFSVLRYATQNGGTGRQDHPHRKPLPLMRRLLRGAPDGIIIDPFMGSGTTLRAAKDLGRKAIGIELDERYCEIAARRLGQEVLAL